MRRGLLVLAAGVALAAEGPALAGSTPAPDARAIRALEDRQAQAWNAHDMTAYAALFAEDADVVNVLGWWWRGRSELGAKLAQAHGSVFRDSVLVVDAVNIRMPAPNVAVVQVTWRMTGARTPDGMAAHTPERGVQTQVLQRRGGGWRILAFQNTNSVPERPFPPPLPPSADAAGLARSNP